MDLLQRRPPITDIPAEYAENCRRRLAAKSRLDESGCINWTGTLQDGYGYIWLYENRHCTAHRAAWILHRGPIASPDLVVDHLCRNRACVNPDHLEPVTIRENVQRGAQIKGDRYVCENGHPRDQFARVDKYGRQVGYCLKCHERPPATHCRNGHDLAVSGYHVEKSGKRTCATCYRERQRRQVPRRRVPLELRKRAPRGGWPEGYGPLQQGGAHRGGL